MKNILKATLFLFVVNSSFSQEKIIEQVEQSLTLKTMTFTLSNDYYEHNFFSAYEYPTITEGYYSVNLFLNFDGLVKFYTELSNLSNLEDGKYNLSTKLSSSHHLYKNQNIVAEKKGTMIKLLSSDSKYARTLMRLKTNDVTADLTYLQPFKK